MYIQECFQIIIIGFLFLKESSSTPIQSDKLCSPSLPARYEQFPHTVFVKTVSKSELLCQGTLIDVSWVLTSVNCINSDVPSDDIYLTMGNETGDTVRKPTRVETNKMEGVTLIEMDRPVTADDTVAPIEMASDDLSKDTECVVSGIEKRPDSRAALIYWNEVNVSEQAHDKSEWHLQDTLCHSDALSTRSILYDGASLICKNHIYGITSIIKPRIINYIFNYKNWIQDVINHTASVDILRATKTKVLNNSFSSGTNTILTNENGFKSYYQNSLNTKKSTTLKYSSSTDDMETTVSEDANSLDFQNVTEDEETTESDDLTSLDFHPVTEDIETNESEDANSVDFQNITEDVETTESNDLTSLDSQNVTKYLERIKFVDSISSGTKKSTTPKSLSSNENINATDNEPYYSSSIVTNVFQKEFVSPTESSSLKFTDYNRETEEGQFSDQPTPQTHTQKSSTTEKCTSSKECAINTTENKIELSKTEDDQNFPFEVEETEDDQFLKQNNSDTSTTQSSTIEKSTPTSLHLTNTTDVTNETDDSQNTNPSIITEAETYETEDGQFSTQPTSNTPTTQSLTTEKSTPTSTHLTNTTDVTNETDDSQNTNPSIITEAETYETEDSQFSTQPTSNTPTTQSVTTESTSSPTEQTTVTYETEDDQSPKPSSTTIKETVETYETEDGQFSTKTSSDTHTTQSPTTEKLTSSPTEETPVTYETNDDQTDGETEDSSPIHVDTPPTTTETSTIITTTKVSTAASTAAKTAATTAATSAATKKTTVIFSSSELTTEKTKSTPTTPETSSSQVTLYNTNLITILCCMMYFINN